MTHVEWLRSQPVSPGVHLALLCIDDPSDDWPEHLFADHPSTREGNSQ